MPEFHAHADGSQCDMVMCQVCEKDKPSCEAKMQWTGWPGHPGKGNVCGECQEFIAKHWG